MERGRCGDSGRRGPDGTRAPAQPRRVRARPSPEHGLHVDDGLGVGHVVLLRAHGALLVHHHQVVRVDDPTLQQAVQAAGGQVSRAPGASRASLTRLPLPGRGDRSRQGGGRPRAAGAGALLVHGALHVVDHGEAADGLQEVVVGPAGTAGAGGARPAPLPPPARGPLGLQPLQADRAILRLHQGKTSAQGWGLPRSDSQVSKVGSGLPGPGVACGDSPCRAECSGDRRNHEGPRCRSPGPGDVETEPAGTWGCAFPGEGQEGSSPAPWRRGRAQGGRAELCAPPPGRGLTCCPAAAPRGSAPCGACSRLAAAR